jgi:hypothetical protein
MGTSKLINSSAAFLFEVPGSNSPLVVQELQIGGTDATRSPQSGRRRELGTPSPVMVNDATQLLSLKSGHNLQLFHI